MRMQQTSSVQHNEVHQYLTHRSASQVSERQKQRALLGSDTLRCDERSVPMSQSTFSTDSSQIHGSQGPYELPDAYNRSIYGSCLMGQSVQPPSTSSGDCSSSAKATGPADHRGSSVSSSIYEAFGRSSSSTSFSTGFGNTDKSAARSSTELQPWICSYCSERNSPAQEIGLKCFRCKNDKVGVRRHGDSSTVSGR